MLALDTDAVTRWLAERGRPGPWEARKFPTGQSNPTYLLRGPGEALVLRRKPPGRLLPSAHAVEREFRVMRALHGGPVPVPEMVALCEDEGVIGAPFYVMTHVPGRSLDDPRLPGLPPEDRAAMTDDMARVLAAIHGTDLAAAGLADYGPGADYAPRQVARWTRQYRASETEPLPDMDALIAWLEAHAPPDDGTRALVHGDYRLDNLLWAEEAPRIAAVLDWELSTIGHPFADLAAVLMQWRRPPGPEGRGLAGVDRTALGLPSDRAFVESYCRHAGRAEAPDLRFWLAFAFFRMAAILQGVLRRALDGNASDPERGRRLGAHVPDFARQGLEAAGGAAGAAGGTG
jgi:aminoglycoside phosphotransferase (APT) family kinase protein